MEWMIAKLQMPQDIISFMNDTFEIMEIRRSVGNEDGVMFAIRTNEGNHVIPHVHAEYGEYSVSIAIESGEIMSGNLPLRKQKQAITWVLNHQAQLLNQWKNIAITAVSHTTKTRLNACL